MNELLTLKIMNAYQKLLLNNSVPGGASGYVKVGIGLMAAEVLLILAAANSSCEE